MSNDSAIQLQKFDVKTGWTMVPDPFEDGAFNDEKLREAGFQVFTQIGVDGGNQIVVYSRPTGGYLVFVDGLDSSVETILAPDFPSMVTLLNLLSPIAIGAELQMVRCAIEDLKELATEREGPLHAAHRTRWERQRREAGQGRKGTISVG